MYATHLRGVLPRPVSRVEDGHGGNGRRPPRAALLEVADDDAVGVALHRAHSVWVQGGMVHQSKGGRGASGS